MRNQSLSRLFAVPATLLVFFAAAPTAWAEAAEDAPVAKKAERCEELVAPPKKEPTTFDKIDKVFGEIAVAPLASLLFSDLMFWDNTISKDEATAYVGKVAKGHQILAFSENPVLDKEGKPTDAVKGLIGRKVEKAEAKHIYSQAPALPPTYKLAYGPVALEIVDDGGEQTARVKAAPLAPLPEGTVSLASYEGRPIPGARDLKDTEGALYRVHADAAIPFPVVVKVAAEDSTEGELVSLPVPFSALEVEKPGGPAPLAVGHKVKVGNDECHLLYEAEVTDLDVDGKVALLGLDQTPLGDGNPDGKSLPFIVAWLVLGAVFFTLRMGFINLRGFGHAIAVVRGKYDHPDDPGEVNHFQALSSALSATVGLGNIAGVAIAVSSGGPGAVFWMIMAGFLGMSSKFVECTLGQMYRHVDDLGVVSGGPMRYLEAGLREKNLGGLGKVLAVVFSIMCIGGSFGGGNMFQANQAFAALAERIPAMAEFGWAFGLVLAVLVGLVIIGGIKRIGAAASFLVPAMCGMYLLAGVLIIVFNVDKVGWAIGQIVSQAFAPDAMYGGALGVLIVGFQRAAFSNEAGVGSASIAHAAASTNEPIREGLVACLEPFIDTIVVCTMTALVVVITGTYQIEGANGVVITSLAFGQTLSWFPWLLTVAVVLFAFSTMISWSYYGERCWTLLFGEKSSMIYRFVFCVFVFLGAVFKLGSVLDFSDLMILGMAFPNIFGLVILSGKVKATLDDYWDRLKSGKMEVTG